VPHNTTVQYSFTVTNTGESTLLNVVLVDNNGTRAIPRRFPGDFDGPARRRLFGGRRLRARVGVHDVRESQSRKCRQDHHQHGPGQRAPITRVRPAGAPIRPR